MRAERIGALSTAFSLWEEGILGMLLYNSESWVSIQKKTMKILDDLFHLFCRIILRTSVSCPKVNFYWQSGSLTFTNHILLRKLNFAHHLSSLEAGALAREVWEEQVSGKELPGLCREIEGHISAMGIAIDELSRFSKWQFKKLAKEYIYKLNKSQLLEEIRLSKKLNYEKCSQERFERKQYFCQQNLENSRVLFRVSSRLIPFIKANYPSKYRRQGKPLTCSSCPPAASASASGTQEPSQEEMTQPIHSQTHVGTTCLLVSDLHSEYRPDDDKSVAEFFKKVIARHMELEEFQ